MNGIPFFIESKNNATPECVFLKKYINRVRPDLIYEVTPMMASLKTC